MHPMELVKEMNLIELIKEFSQKYKSSLLHNFTIFLDIEKDDQNINMINIKQDEKDIINYCNKLFYQLFITNESIKSLKYTMSPPFVLENLDKKIYISCPYYDNNKLKLAPCLPIGIYNNNLKIFSWLNDSVREKIKYHKIGKHIDMFCHSQITNIESETARNLMLLFRALWFDLGISFIFNDSKVNMKTNSLISFQINDTPSEKYLLFCLIDLGLKQQNNLIESKINLLEKYIYDSIVNKENNYEEH